MKSELHPLITELCFLAVTRNAINTRRHRARYRKNYYAWAVRVVEAHNMSNFETRNLRARVAESNGNLTDAEISQLNKRLRAIMQEMEGICERHPNPKKWKEMGLHKLRSLVLQGEGEYAMAKHETMEFSIKHRARVRQITKALKCSLHYNNGTLESIHFNAKPNTSLPHKFFDLEEIHHYAEQYELTLAVEKMIKE